jgi:hypothetical protein
MTTLLAIAITWYLTKIYYTKSFAIKSYEVEVGLVRAACVKCSRVSIITQQNMRTPFYCTTCH